MKNYILWFYHIWKQEKKRMIFIFILTIITILIKTAFPLLFKKILDELAKLTPTSPTREINQLIIFYAMVAIVHEFLARFLPTIRGVLNMRFAALIRTTYYRKVSRQMPEFFQKFKVGDILTRLTDDIDGSWERISWYSCSGIFRPLEATLVLLFTLGVMFYHSPLLTLSSFLLLPFLVIILAKMEEKMFKYTTEKQESISKCNEQLDSFFSGIRIIKITNSEKNHLEKYKVLTNDRIHKEFLFLKLNQTIHLCSMLINNIGHITVIFLGSYLVLKNEITIGTLLLFILYHQRLIEPLWTLVFFYATSKQIFRYVDRLSELKVDERKDHLKFKKKRIDHFNNLTFHNVDFSFQGREGRKVLNDISIAIQKGDRIGVIGQIGAGKSTLLDLISQNISPTRGQIRLNDKRLDKITTLDLARIIGHVEQENTLFSETVLDNLLLGDKEKYSEEDINKALKDALIYDEMMNKKDALFSKLGEKGLSLSGGQKQRLCLARTLLRKPELLLMDDVTAAMDALTEERFWSQFLYQYPSITCLVVTHRLSTIRVMNKVLILNKGVVANFGPTDHLLKTDPIIQELLVTESFRRGIVKPS